MRLETTRNLKRKLLKNRSVVSKQQGYGWSWNG